MKKTYTAVEMIQFVRWFEQEKTAGRLSATEGYDDLLVRWLSGFKSAADPKLHTVATPELTKVSPTLDDLELDGTKHKLWVDGERYYGRVRLKGVRLRSDTLQPGEEGGIPLEYSLLYSMPDIDFTK